VNLSQFVEAYGDAISDAVVRAYPPIYDAAGGAPAPSQADCPPGTTKPGCRA
jgi:hypothetical protein